MKFFKKTAHLVLNWSIAAASTDAPAKSQDKKGDKKIDFAIGGQAVIEGVMMRSPNNITIAVRKPSGKVKVDKRPYNTLTQRYKWLNIPILRGVVNLFEMMVIGTKAINFSANESLEEEEHEEQSRSAAKAPSKWGKALEIGMFSLSLVLALTLSLFLFKFIPLGLTTLLESQSSFIQKNYIVFNLIDGFIKTLIFFSYIFLLSLIPSFRRVFEYHGAEHKSIFTYEKKLPLEPEHAKAQTRFHPRCGTSFIIIVFVISILVYTFVPKQEAFINNLLLRITFLPIIAGISYEYLKLSAKYVDNKFVKALVAPGLWFQRLTTKEPDRSQLEIGLASLKTALEMEKAASA
ncbi:MAG: DUF1385 domain-containing protein [Nitrospirae bacterium]|nr:DUF1385 domain-containing protein [Nitrospirota bacterium]